MRSLFYHMNLYYAEMLLYWLLAMLITFFFIRLKVSVLELASDGIIISFGSLVLGAAFDFYQRVHFVCELSCLVHNIDFVLFV